MKSFRKLFLVLLMLSLSTAGHGEKEKIDMSISRAMAEIAINTTSEEITDKAYDATKIFILDTLGTIIAGYNAPGMQPIMDQMKEWGGKPESHILVYGGKVPAPNAAFINGSMAHALDLDDVHLPASLHIMSSVLPVSFAVGEMINSSGTDVMAAIAMGVEVAGRLGVGYAKTRQHGGFLPASIIGGFGATASTCRLLGLTVDETVQALGIFYAQASGNRQALYDHTLTKRIQPAFAAEAGIWAAFLAKRGVTGHHNAFEGVVGLFRIYGSKEVPPKEIMIGDRDFFEIERTSVKMFPTCGASHPAILAALDIANEYDLKPEDIAAVEIYLGGARNLMVGVPFKMGPNPQVDAQFCAPYEVALALIRRHVNPADITDEQIRKDTEVAELAQQVEILTKWDFEPGENKRAHVVKVQTKDGRTLVRSREGKDVLNPALFSYHDVARKFRDCAESSGVCSPEKADSIVDLVKEFEEITDVEDFVKKNLLLPGIK